MPHTYLDKKTFTIASAPSCRDAYAPAGRSRESASCPSDVVRVTNDAYDRKSEPIVTGEIYVHACIIRCTIAAKHFGSPSTFYVAKGLSSSCACRKEARGFNRAADQYQFSSQRPSPRDFALDGIRLTFPGSRLVLPRRQPHDFSPVRGVA